MEQEVSKRPRRSTKEVQELIQQYEKSGLSAKQFCKVHGLREAGFYKLRNRYHNKIKTKQKPGFIPVGICSAPTATVQSSLFCEVKGIKIYQPVSATFLKELIK
jgi:hypothetical protein